MDENKKDLETTEAIGENGENINQEIHQEEIKELLNNQEEVKKETKEEVKEEVKISTEKKGILLRLIASIIDQTIAIGLSVALLFVFNAILKIFGYEVAQRQPVFFIIFVIVNVIYSPIMESTKVKATLGRKLLKL
ncbi:RDD family protein [Clostridium cavendishii DSM 21758]|uniref:RDD family protein n=1 Tax=Clostridium cavendishii DSM 21758 TaxID=1121302 RepID=A0A1M6BG22_9CLOT|nr:RDD family protein [Clostridium cavendishii]SHI47617.1 RDD family protein [Clostridium cavendishii DSM 21758]